MRPTLFLPLILTAFASFASAAPVEPRLAPLLDLIERRLDIAEAVALHKWDLGQPVQDDERERQIIANVRREAPKHGLDPDRAEAFFIDQMSAGKLIQRSLLDRWKASGQAPDTPRQDLRAELRPRLDALQHELLRNLALFEQAGVPTCGPWLYHATISRSNDLLRQAALGVATLPLCEEAR
ncbi:chorismate mutase [Pseudomonas entomophila]|jgi:chorismate mutase|uniref:chorismate mutase n=1 Tax=Pseudomonas entomophila TaxID=312306 RepID=UPI0015E2D796|nr:chorismate mutase [Pseudomonas entomophila]MBA1193782.1 chorismate mutase [Pseudomonas entomophila]